MEHPESCNELFYCPPQWASTDGQRRYLLRKNHSGNWITAIEESRPIVVRGRVTKGWSRRCLAQPLASFNEATRYIDSLVNLDKANGRTYRTEW
jgi:hypothetical protein